MKRESHVERTVQMKGLQVRKTKVEEALKIANENKRQAIEDVDKVRQELKLINSSIERLTDDEIVITEHARLRYLEKCMGIDMTEVDKKILSETTKEQISVLGSGKYTSNEGFTVVVKKNTIVTVLPSDDKTGGNSEKKNKTNKQNKVNKTNKIK